MKKILFKILVRVFKKELNDWLDYHNTLILKSCEKLVFSDLEKDLFICKFKKEIIRNTTITINNLNEK